ncbi:MAG: pyruvate dehydrogenase complex dihydrolipoamide acetyltransferase [Alphaproteobacteria bacterium]|nr:pyruvate dehydrogenase complex dihydrolipoamide acetyltransferase [Alphaproteobacteria bacterium]
MTDILMPALSPTMEEGGLAKWLVKPGDVVTSGMIIAEIETDKATMEVEAVDEGIVEALLVEAGAQGVKVNTPIARLKSEGAAATPKRAPEPQTKAPPVAEATPANVAQPAPAAPSRSAGGRIAVSPLARRIAEQSGIDLSGLKGTGPNGRIVKADVEAAMSKAPASSAQQNGSRALTVPPASLTPKTLEQMGIEPGSYDLVPLDMMRKTIARRLTDSFRDVPHFPLTIDLEIDKLLKARGEINARFADQGVKISVNDIIIKACALSLMRVPESNASYSPEGIALHHHADVAVAVAIDGGLITPIIRHAETKGLATISAEMADLAQRARDRKLKPHEYQGGTFSLSNLGMMGIKSFASILNEPQGMIMSVGAGEKRPVVRNDALAIATVMTVTLTCDHRVVDGAIGSAYLKAFKGFIEDPMAMLL